MAPRCGAASEQLRACARGTPTLVGKKRAADARASGGHSLKTVCYEVSSCLRWCSVRWSAIFLCMQPPMDQSNMRGCRSARPPTYTAVTSRTAWVFGRGEGPLNWAALLGFDGFDDRAQGEPQQAMAKSRREKDLMAWRFNGARKACRGRVAPTQGRAGLKTAFGRWSALPEPGTDCHMHSLNTPFGRAGLVIPISAQAVSTPDALAPHAALPLMHAPTAQPIRSAQGAVL